MFKLIAMETKLHDQNSPQKTHEPPGSQLHEKVPLRKLKREFTIAERNLIVIEGQSGQRSIGDICMREGITPATFYQWSVEFLEAQNDHNKATEIVSKIRNDSDRFKVVIEGKSGETGVQEILKREHISHEVFLQWCRDFARYRQKLSQTDAVRQSIYDSYKNRICRLSGDEVFDFIEHYIDFTIENQVIIPDGNLADFKWNMQADSIICLQKINDIRYINAFFEKANASLPLDGMLVGCLETFTARMDRLNIYKVPVISNIYFGMEFLFKRIIPKLSLTKKYYFDFTKGSDQLISKAEGLGRLVSCGFKIMDYKSINGQIYFVVKKEKEPSFDRSPSYGPLYAMPRIGKDGKIIKVYKLRTMHPYSEYLQDYVLKVNGYAKTGKPADDFRIPSWGKFMRRYWLDEIPQLYNVLKGDLKLVGIRPVSERYFKDIPKEMQRLRLTQKPGCVPPYVSLNRNGNVMSVLQAEKEYLEEKIRNPYTTDTKYFFKAIFNIVFKHKRSA